MDIPNGAHCFSVARNEAGELDVFPCPFLEVHHKEGRIIGECKYLGIKDTPKLNRQIKECKDVGP